MSEGFPRVCTCKWKSCKRHGNCHECVAHHKEHSKYPVPFCQKKKTAKKNNENNTNANP